MEITYEKITKKHTEKARKLQIKITQHTKNNLNKKNENTLEITYGKNEITYEKRVISKYHENGAKGQQIIKIEITRE